MPYYNYPLIDYYLWIQLRHWANQHETTSKLDNELKGQGIID